MKKNEKFAKNLMEISVIIPKELGDSVAGYLMELGTPAVEEVISEDSITLVAFYDCDGINSKISAIGSFITQLTSSASLGAKPPKIKVKKREDKSWAEEARKSFKPIIIAEDFWVAPTWTDIKDMPYGKVINIDPGEAFGTGAHPTTRQAGQLLVEVIAIKRSPAVLDVGTGSGILAILAKKAGAGRVLAIDNDPRAIEVAMDNFSLNNCYIEVSPLPVRELKEKFDIVVANILLETLLDMAPHLKKVTKKGGNIILAGLLVEQGDEMRYRMMEIGFNAPHKELIENGWLAMRFKV